MPNTFTTNFNLTKPEIGGANDTWGTLVNANLDDVDTALYRKADKLDQKGVAHTLSFDSNNNFVTTNVARGFASFAQGDKITISNSSSNAANKGDFKIEGITNDITLDLELLDDTEPSFVTQSIASTVSIISEHTKIITSDFDISAGTLTTSTAQNDVIVDGSSAISRNAGGIKSISITTAGADYSGSGTLTASGGAGSGFAGAYTVSSGAIATVDITNAGSGYTSVPTIVVSGSNTAGSTDAVITAVLQTTNDLIFASDVSVTGVLNTGGITATGSLNAAGLNITGSGGISEDVTMTGVPRKTKFILVVPSGGSQFSTTYTNTTEYATHDGVPFDTVQGKTYHIHAKYRTWSQTNDDQTINTYAVKLYYGSTVCARGATGNVAGGSFGTILDYRPHSFRVEGLDGASSISDGGGEVSGIFTEGASGTTNNFAQLVMFNQNQTTQAYMDFHASYQYCIFTIQEYDSDNFTSHNMQ